MKQLIVLFIALFGFVIAGAQSTAETTQQQAAGTRGQVKTFYGYSQHDTISTSTSAHTFQLTCPATFYENMDCVASITADSLSGGTTAVATIQGSADPDGVEWQTIGTAVTINGVETKSRQTFQLVEPKIRLNVAAASSTQSTRVRFEIGCKVR